ncbi:hypothetical protein BH10PSE7_BH10PSE7_30590 [soil metagenome]
MPAKFATTDLERLEAAVRQARYGGLLQIRGAKRPFPASRVVTLILSQLAVLIAAALQIALMSSVPDNDALYLILILAILFSAAIGGLIEGALATLMCLSVSIWLVGRQHELTYATLVNSIVFTTAGLGLSVLGEFFHLIKHRVALTAEHLRGRESYLRSILATIPDAMILVDEEGCIRSFSGAAERLFGYTAADTMGKPVGLLMTLDSGELNDTSPDVVVPRIGIGKRIDGTTFPLELVGGEMKSEGRHYFNTFIRDITERRETEARMADLQSGMTHYSRLTAMGEMASALAHELNQPLSAITNYLRGLERAAEGPSPLDELTRKAVMGKAVEQAIRAGGIITRLRDFVSRGETERHVESLRKLVEEASAFALVGFRESGIQVSYDFGVDFDLVVADGVQIQQVVLNLVRNALEAASDAADRRIVISISAGFGDAFTVRVSDSGKGVSGTVADRLFQPFTTTKRDGMGVGLSISRTIIESHGGKIWYEPMPEGGAAFCFTIPRITNDAIEDAA